METVKKPVFFLLDGFRDPKKRGPGDQIRRPRKRPMIGGL
jgi:hypothetical protein